MSIQNADINSFYIFLKNHLMRLSHSEYLGLPLSPSRVVLKVLRFQEARRSFRDTNIPLIDEEDEDDIADEDDFAQDKIRAVEAQSDRRDIDPITSEHAIGGIDNKEVRLLYYKTFYLCIYPYVPDG